MSCYSLVSNCCCSPSAAPRHLTLCRHGVVAASRRPCCRHTTCRQVCRRSRGCSSGMRHEGQGRSAQVRPHPPLLIHDSSRHTVCFLPQPPGRCQCRWQGRRRRVQGGVCCAQQSCCRACLSHRFCRLALLPKLRLLKQRQQVCAKGLCSCAPPPASFSRRSRGGRGGQAFVKFVLPAFYFGANNTTTCCP